ncbi:hypothetical protein [Aureimonas pseudogalii]|uniref:Uncharacterized protein n=1 Tax=Aureimonas pseudogalii TaxID=1744844 RepID=A0A7W6H3S3_9HYPH|nr:hypothetical protein [Aureimonas pseudogalii]MBB3997203.1 hypothetical protein [Aureimonas pseudogalii]
MSVTAIQAGHEAATLLEKIEPFLADLERESMESALMAPYWQPEGTREARHHLDEVNAIRALRQRIQTTVMLGKIETQKNALTPTI